MQVVWARYVSAFLLALFMFSNPITRPGLLRTSRPVLQLGRSALLLGSTVFNFMAFRYLQLDEALAILFSTPFLVAILAGPMLGEWVGWRRWTAIMVGFCRRAAGDRGPGSAACIGRRCSRSAARSATRLQRSRRAMLSRTDTSETTLFYANLVGAVVMAAGAAVRLDAADRPWIDWS